MPTGIHDFYSFLAVARGSLGLLMSMSTVSPCIALLPADANHLFISLLLCSKVLEKSRSIVFWWSLLRFSMWLWSARSRGCRTLGLCRVMELQGVHSRRTGGGDPSAMAVDRGSYVPSDHSCEYHERHDRSACLSRSLLLCCDGFVLIECSSQRATLEVIDASD